MILSRSDMELQVLYHLASIGINPGSESSSCQKIGRVRKVPLNVSKMVM